MCKRIFPFLGIFIFVAFFFGDIRAQNTGGKDYASSPYWIEMMKDTNTNYFETVTAFNTYWKGRQKPEDENEKFANAGKKENEAKNKNIPYSFEYRKFQRWQMQMKPYVQNDGKILYPYQRLQLSRNSRSAKPLNTAK